MPVGWPGVGVRVDEGAGVNRAHVLLVEVLDLLAACDVAYTDLDLDDRIEVGEALTNDVIPAARAVLAGVEASILGDLAGNYQHRTIGKVERAWQSGRRTWDTPRLLGVVAEAAKDERRLNREGEVEGEGDAVARVIGEVARIEWRTTDLKRRNIDPEAFSATDPGRHVLRFPKREGAA